MTRPSAPAHACKRCSVGAAHAGGQPAPATARECIRCDRRGGKLVRGLLCVSCYNRQQEVVKGRDRRGRTPHARVYLWDKEPQRIRGAMPAIFAIQVNIDGRVHRFLAATFREAFRSADRLFFRGQPLALSVTNAREIGLQAPRHHPGRTS